MTISAPVAVRHVIEEYQRFLKTSFRFLAPRLRDQFEAHLQQMDVLVRGPYVTLVREFQRGKRLRDLVDEGLLDARVVQAHWPFGEAPLYLHQERAARAGAAGWPYLVTTGTGSGKTEAFLPGAECHRPAHDAARRLCPQAAGTEAGGGVLWLDKDDRRGPQAALPRGGKNQLWATFTAVAYNLIRISNFDTQPA